MNVTQQELATSASRYEVLTFGRFRLDPVQHVLHEDDKPLRLGGRALEILIVLAERTGQIVSNHELLAKVWPKSIVQDATLRVHIAALRKALHDGECGARYVENFSGRGYRFLAPVVRRQESASQWPARTQIAAAPVATRVEAPPARLARIIGRTHAIATLAERIPQCRFVTLAGPGGIGKSVVAAAAAQKLTDTYAQGIRVIECSALSEPHELVAAVGSALQMSLGLDEEALPALLSFLHPKSLLLVLDNCDRVVESAAALAEQVLLAAPGVHLLATSREPLRAESEHVHRLAPLAAPAPTQVLTREEALSYPAIKLFMERASACVDSFELHEADVPVLAQICTLLEGNPLAIALAAARVDLFGIRGLAAGMGDSLRLLTRGRRTALPRHQSLRASLDWSYESLSSLERVVLRRLAVFCSPFDMESAYTVAEDGQICAAEVLDTLTNLVAKSLLVTELVGEKTLYRLPETTRAYAFEKLQDSDEVGQAMLLHSETWPALGMGRSCSTGLPAEYAEVPRVEARAGVDSGGVQVK